MSDQIDIDKYTAQYHEFLQGFDTLQLATVNSEGVPEASYAPHIHDGRCFYIYVSELSTHTSNILSSPTVSILLLEDEVNANHPFARRRITLQANATEIPRDTEPFIQQLDAFEEKFGKFMTMLRGLTDFHLFQLTVLSGNYVAGFGKAFELTGENLQQLEHIRKK